MKLDKKIFEIIFHARGGQGSETAAELLAEEALREGNLSRLFQISGPKERRAMKTYVRISDGTDQDARAGSRSGYGGRARRNAFGVIEISKNLDENESLM